MEVIVSRVIYCIIIDICLLCQGPSYFTNSKNTDPHAFHLSTDVWFPSHQKKLCVPSLYFPLIILVFSFFHFHMSFTFLRIFPTPLDESIILIIWYHRTCPIVVMNESLSLHHENVCLVKGLLFSSELVSVWTGVPIRFATWGNIRFFSIPFVFHFKKISTG